MALLYILLKVAVCAIVVYLIIAVLGWVGFPVPAIVIKLLWLIVGLIALIMLVQLLLGVPVVRVL